MQKEIIIAVLEKDGLLIVATIIDMIETAICELHSSKIKKVSIMAMQVSCEVRRLTTLRCLDAMKSLQEEMIIEVLEKDSLLIVATIIDMIETDLRELHSSKIKKVLKTVMQVSCEVRRLTPLRCLDALKSLQEEMIIAFLKKDSLFVVATIIDMIETDLRELHSSKIKKVLKMVMQVSCEVRRLTPLRCLDALKSLQEEMIIAFLEKDSLFIVATIIDLAETTLRELHSSKIKKV